MCGIVSIRIFALRIFAINICIYLGIRVVVIGVGDGLNSKYVKCLVQSDSDWIPVADFSTAAFDSIMGSLSGILCPQSKECKITEVKAEKKPSTWNYRWGRFVEIYNFGIDFNLQAILLTGLVSASLGALPDVTVTQGQYLVFYDAADAPFDTTGPYGSTPTCHLCEWDSSNNDLPCDLSGCLFAGNDGYVGTCFCGNAVYVACRNTATANQCSTNPALSNSNTHAACSACTFDDTMVCNIYR